MSHALLNDLSEVHHIGQNIHHHGGCPDRDRMAIGLTTTYAVRAYHHFRCEFESRSGRGVQHFVIKFVSDLRQVGVFLRFPPPIKLTAMI